MNTFHKNERITSLKLIEHLFRDGESKAATAFPLKAVYTFVPHQEGCAPVQVLISVPKRHFKRAVKRNRVKRQVREGYRLNKIILSEVPEGQQMLIAFIWLADKLYPSSKVHAQVITLLEKIKKTYSQDT